MALPKTLSSITDTVNSDGSGGALDLVQMLSNPIQLVRLLPLDGPQTLGHHQPLDTVRTSRRIDGCHRSAHRVSEEVDRTAEMVHQCIEIREEVCEVVVAPLSNVVRLTEAALVGGEPSARETSGDLCKGHPVIKPPVQTDVGNTVIALAEFSDEEVQASYIQGPVSHVRD